MPYPSKRTGAGRQKFGVFFRIVAAGYRYRFILNPAGGIFHKLELLRGFIFIVRVASRKMQANEIHILQAS